MKKYLYAIRSFKIKPWIKYYLLKNTKNVLPNTYQQVEYLEASGTQYIDTNFTPNINTKAYAEFYVSTIPCGLYSSDSGASLSTNFSSYISSGGKWRFGSGSATVPISNNTFYTSIQDKIGITINGTNFYEYDTTITDFTSTRTITLLRTNTIGFKGKIYKFKLYDGNKIVRNFIPCYRKSDDEAGMYDVVNGVFYTNEGTGDFVVGEDVLPNTYQKVDYLESTGTQYIDTNYALWTNTNWKIEYKFDVNEFYNYNNMIGSLETSNSYNEIWITSDGNYYIRFTDVGRTSLGILELNTPYTIIHDNTGTNLLNYVNGELVQTTNKANTSLDYKLGLGHREGAKYLKGKIYYAKFWNGNELVRNFVPCYRKSDNKPGMYDTVNNVFYTNEGDGEFNYEI